MTAPRILVVDDNPTNLRLASFALERAGYDVHTATDVATATRAIADLGPSLVLMDIQLPDGDGLELTRRLRADPENAGLRIIALTAFAMNGDEERALAAGCDAYVTKPVLPDALRAVVADQLVRQSEAART